MALAISDGAPLLSAMLGWSINLFRIRGIQLQLHFTFFVLLAVVGFDDWTDAGWPGLLWGLATLLAFLTDSRYLQPLAWAAAAVGLYAIYDYARAIPTETRPVGG